MRTSVEKGSRKDRDKKNLVESSPKKNRNVVERRNGETIDQESCKNYELSYPKGRTTSPSNRRCAIV